ncbi:glycine zipper domain-containing protein [Chromatocurvus halotolerans]|uniref:Outer membrane protein with glycine zipper n=1 Tax=Chromatocurvus halotolerans TaxID=1132028 RepID=A0A4R2KTE2_9GAMM|nr:glycine zipper domain-containing protein [Chromatocurvus halotolerans]TCO77053.1 outer membrane protein with glycine zipper [Chromatocurvus halotolerans]
MKILQPSAQSPGALVLLCVCMLVTGCTTTRNVIIDQKGVDMNRYRQDLAECKEYAREVRKGEMVARGAGSGAAVGGAIGAIVGDSTDSAVRGAGVGAVSGGARGMSAGEREEMQVIKRCLRGRGYRVLN